MSYPPDPNGPYQPPVDPFESPPGADPPGGGFGGFPGPSQPQQPPQHPPQQPPASPPPTWVPPSAPASPPYAPASPAYGPASPPYGQPTSPYGNQPPGPYGPGGPGGPGGPQPPYGPGGPPPKRKRGLLIMGVVAAAALVLCAGGAITAFVVTRDGDRNGPTTAEAAVDDFLQAVYREQDAGRAAALVCEESRDEAATTEKIDEIRRYQEELAEPEFTWSQLRVIEQTEDLATVGTTVTVVTADEKTASLGFEFEVLDKGSNGWWVCDLETVSTEAGAAPPPEDEGATEEDAGSGE